MIIIEGYSKKQTKCTIIDLCTNTYVLDDAGPCR